MAGDRREVVLITGAAGSLGQAVARAFAARGAALALTDRSQERLAALSASLPGPSFHQVADVANGDSALSLCEKVAAELGGIDVLVNVAGGFRMGPVEETTAETWDWLMDLNARSVLNMAR